MALDLAYLEDFQALAAAGNFSRAATLRNMTQPAYSRRIQALEDWAGAALFDREAQPITLTEAGRALQPMVAEALRCLLQGRDAARAAAARSRATLHFAATHVLSFTFLPAWLRGLETGQPLEAVQLISDTLRACERYMLHGQVQFLLCHHHPSAPVQLDGTRFISARVGGDVLCPVVAATEDGEPRYSLDAESRAPVPYLAYSGESGLGRIVAAFWNANAAGMRLATVFTSHLAAALASTTRAGRGIAWLPRSLVAEDLGQGKLVRAGPRALDIAIDIHLFRPVSPLSPIAERFWSLIANSA